jgi:hypothetical protein
MNGKDLLNDSMGYGRRKGFLRIIRILELGQRNDGIFTK